MPGDDKLRVRTKEMETPLVEINGAIISRTLDAKPSHLLTDESAYL